MDFSVFHSRFSSCVMVSQESILIHRYNLYYNFDFLHNFGKKTLERFCVRNNLGLDVGQMYYTVFVAPSFSWSRIEQPNDLVQELIKQVYVNEIGLELPENFKLETNSFEIAF